MKYNRKYSAIFKVLLLIYKINLYAALISAVILSKTQCCVYLVAFILGKWIKKIVSFGYTGSKIHPRLFYIL